MLLNRRTNRKSDDLRPPTETLSWTVPEIGKLLVLIGAAFVVVGALLWSGVGKGWFGQLPGDINYSKGNFSFHFPIVTCIVLSILLTLLMRLFRK